MKYSNVYYDDSENDILKEGAPALAAAAAKSGLRKWLGRAITAGKYGGTATGSAYAMHKLGQESMRNAAEDKAMTAAQKIIDDAIKEKQSPVASTTATPEPPLYGPPQLPRDPVTPNVDNKSKNLALKGAALGAGVIAAGTLAATLIKKALDKKKMLYDGCDSYTLPEDIARCKNYVQKRHIQDLQNSLKRCKYSNDPKECQERIENELNSIIG